MGLTEAGKAVGIRFFVKSSLKERSSTSQARFMGTVEMIAHFDREDLWYSVLKRLDGIQLYKGGDLQTTLIEILQGQVDILEKQVAAQSTVDRERAQVAEQSASIAVSDCVRAQQHSGLLQAQLDMRTRERDTALAENKRWVNWYCQHKSTCPLEPG
jgi:hypothetical protein